jgi:hypothetical protein
VVKILEFDKPVKIIMSVTYIEINDTAYGKIVQINGIIKNATHLEEIGIICDSELEYLLRKNNLRKRDTLTIEYLGKHQVKTIEKVPIYKVHVLRELGELSDEFNWKVCPLCGSGLQMEIYIVKRKTNRTFFICTKCEFIVGLTKGVSK